MIVVRWRLKPRARATSTLGERCEERVHSLGLRLDENLTISELCDHLGELRQRPVRVAALPLPAAGPHGLWVSTEANDYIFVEERLVPIHQQQVILHEIGHVLCDHEASPIMSSDASRLLMPSLDPGLVRRVMGREHSDAEAEVEAELVGSLIGRRINAWGDRRTWPVPPEARAIALRLAALESPTHEKCVE
ncbi:ImmA/IrrE family metallo-endopeptidase [Streptomyces sp. NPDC059917]|uniref:ImmA/IrrE family metallo-endopeptidase n=1 Tax=Streptomyces sp. NPDC059917 TaxID=3347002 RepID=UPI0036655FE6